ncbi:Thermospermine synthase ACAULIS5 [Phytophthora nicotianae]|uniref:oligopeptidase A n=1 Tax=Phytophthora nicotianae TaxID=4792 RepID=A0A0W8DGL8_PHYNI|nr:Thermospermine synthase ACAULIS5 [Phytophthora nicotianae]
MLLRCVRPLRAAPKGAASRRSSLFWRIFASASSNSLEACVRERQLPPFERLQLDEIEPAITNAAADYTRDLHELEKKLRDAGENVQFGDVVDPLEVQGDALGRMWGIVGHLMSVRNSEELRAVHDKLQQLVIKTVTEASQSKTLYDAYLAVRESDEWSKLELAQQRIIELSLRSATLSGVGLEGEEKEKFNRLKLRAAELSTKFSSNLLDATKAYSITITDKNEMEGLPPSLLQMFAQSARDEGHSDASPENGPWRITLDPPSYVQFMKYSANRSLRETLYRAYATRASGEAFDNEGIILELLEIRQQIANLLGFNSYAECIAIAHEEVKTVAEYAEQHGQSEPLAPWDLGYWSEKLKAEKYLFTDEEIKPFFPLERVLDGLFSLTSRLFGVTIEAADGQAEVWNPDPPTWPQGAGWQAHSGGLHHLQSVATRGRDASLMTFREVETLFHEFGHGLQHMLTQMEYGDVAGINGIEWDAVEIPSQMMENFCYDKDTIAAISGHYKTGEPLPDDLFEKLKSARNYMVATGMLRQLGFGALDMYLHSHYSSLEEPLFAVQQRLLSEYAVLSPLEEDRFLCSFAHIFAGGYAAGYYSYKWAEILSCDAYGAFEEAAKESPGAAARVGRKFRDTILARGGGQHPEQVFEAFRGRKPSMVPLLTQYGLADN